jgi:type II secretory pathway pseudopilin PulG
VKRRLRDDAGDTLVEITMALAIMAIAVVAVLAAMKTLTHDNTVHQGQTQADAVLHQAAEAISAATYTECATAATYTSSLPSSSSVTLSIPSSGGVKYWDGTFGGGNFTTTAPTTCSNTPKTDNGVQLIHVTAVATGTSVSQSIDVVKKRS